MAAGITYDKLATTTLNSAQSSVTFSSISASYTDLILIVNAYETANGYIKVRYNNDSGTNYSRTYMYGNGTSALSSRQTNETSHFLMAETATANSTNVFQIMNYASTATYKTVLNRQSNASGSVWHVALYWRSNSAIDSIYLTSSDGTSAIASGSTFTLYGIKAA